MLSSVIAPSAAPVVPPGALSLDSLGSVEDEEHIILLGGAGPELMCALLRAGAGNVTHLHANDRPPPASASLVIVPRLPSLDWLAASMAAIRRALLNGGRLVLRTDAPRAVRAEIRRILGLHGMIVTHAGMGFGADMISATPSSQSLA